MTVLSLSILPSAVRLLGEGFAPMQQARRTTQNLATATSFEEDLALTLKVILDHEARSTTASKDQMLSQMAQAEKVDEEEPVDLSIPC